jgi:hypothetical protein
MKYNNFLLALALITGFSATQTQASEAQSTQANNSSIFSRMYQSASNNAASLFNWLKATGSSLPGAGLAQSGFQYARETVESIGYKNSVLAFTAATSVLLYLGFDPKKLADIILSMAQATKDAAIYAGQTAAENPIKTTLGIGALALIPAGQADKQLIYGKVAQDIVEKIASKFPTGTTLNDIQRKVLTDVFQNYMLTDPDTAKIRNTKGNNIIMNDFAIIMQTNISKILEKIELDVISQKLKDQIKIAIQPSNAQTTTQAPTTYNQSFVNPYKTPLTTLQQPIQQRYAPQVSR